VISAVNTSDSEKEKQTVNINASSVQSPSNKNMKHKILLIGNSHIKDCAERTKDNLNKMHRVTGFEKPGADDNIQSSSIELMVKF
jgi:hypothetical protein